MSAADSERIIAKNRERYTTQQTSPEPEAVAPTVEPESVKPLSDDAGSGPTDAADKW
jgi:hypothetical protein